MICVICGKETNTVYAGDICPDCWDNPKKIIKDCFGFYDDGDDECESCPDSDACFEKGAV